MRRRAEGKRNCPGFPGQPRGSPKTVAQDPCRAQRAIPGPGKQGRPQELGPGFRGSSLRMDRLRSMFSWLPRNPGSIGQYPMSLPRGGAAPGGVAELSRGGCIQSASGAGSRPAPAGDSTAPANMNEDHSHPNPDYCALEGDAAREAECSPVVPRFPICLLCGSATAVCELTGDPECPTRVSSRACSRRNLQAKNPENPPAPKCPVG